MKTYFAVIVSIAVLCGYPAGRLAHAQFAERERLFLAEPFRGVTTGGDIVPDLFAIASTGVSTAPVIDAATAFLATLSDVQRAQTVFPVDDDEWRKWANIHRYARQGIAFKDMIDRQQDAAIGLMRASLSAKGLKMSRDIMRLNETLAELTGKRDEYGEGLYWVTVMGEPSATQPWGWQLDGHHLIVNYFVLGDQVVMTPTFMGSEPTIAAAGKYAGTRILDAEAERALDFINGLDNNQRAIAIVATEKEGNNNQTELFKDNVVIPYAGIAGDALNDHQKGDLVGLISLYVGNMDDGHARVKMDEIKGHLGETHFAWVGGTSPDSVFYYRIHSPVILIEFDHQLPVALPGERKPGREHVHTVVRTPNGNDYGKDLLRQHYDANRNNPDHRHE
ncbi:MAG: DUF3500 domain-containing protein [Rhodobacteraceae bacterium]|nr:DUF3500 domain-containing protein [Paracoccaceae bacterium]